MNENIVGIIGPKEYTDRGSLFRSLDSLNAVQYFICAGGSFNQDVLLYLGKTQGRSLRNVVIKNLLSDHMVEEQEVIKRWATRIIDLKCNEPVPNECDKTYLSESVGRVVVFMAEESKEENNDIILYLQHTGKNIQYFPLVRFDENDVMIFSREKFIVWLKSMKRQKVELMSIKSLILNYIENNLLMNLTEFMIMLDEPDYKTLEEWFYN